MPYINSYDRKVQTGLDWSENLLNMIWFWLIIFFSDVRTVAKAFIALGLEPRKSVGIIGFNSPEWFMADLAAIFANSMATGIYSTNSPEMCKYMANHSNANIIVVEDDSQLQKILKVKSELPGKILFKLVQIRLKMFNLA